MDYKPVNYDDSYKLLQNYCTEHNERVGKKHIKTPHFEFAAKLIRELAKQVKAKSNTSGAVLSHESTFLLSKSRRYYCTVEGEGEKFRECKKAKEKYLDFTATVTVRTIANWLDRLEEVGLIKRLNKGRAQVTIAINPKVLKITAGYEIIRHKLLEIFNKNASILEKRIFLIESEVRNEYRKNFHTNTSTEINNNNITTHVDMINTVKHDENLANLFLLEAPKNQKEDLSNKNWKQNTGSPGDTSSVLKRNTFINETVIYLYMWILTNLYRDKDLSDSQHRKIVEYFIADADSKQSVFLKEQYLELTMKRLRKWAKFVDRDPENRFTPLPSAFFDDTKSHSFLHTLQWLKDDSHSQKIKKQNYVVAKQTRQSIHLINPNKTVGSKHQRAYLPLNQLLSELERREKQVMRFASKNDRPDLLTKYKNAIDNELQQVNWGNYA